MACPLIPRSVRALRQNGSTGILSSYQSVRHESTARRLTKKHKIHEAPSFDGAGFAADHIVFNPPSSIPNAYHTPLKFLPKGDKRRELYAAHSALANDSESSTSIITGAGIAQTGTALAQADATLQSLLNPNIIPVAPSSGIQYSSISSLPPAVRSPYEKKYNCTSENIAEIRRLRTENPRQWTRKRLADKFGCSQFFIAIVCQSPEMMEWKRAEDDKAREKWGRRKTEAREDRKKRRDAWGRDA